MSDGLRRLRAAVASMLADARAGLESNRGLVGNMEALAEFSRHRGRCELAVETLAAIDAEPNVPLIDVSRIPQRILDGFERYRHGVPTGSCMRAVLEGDLFKAMAHADDEVLLALPAIVTYVRCSMPAGSWGSPEVVSRWLARGRT